MSSKLLGCLEHRLYKLFPLCFRIVWLDTSCRIHAIFYGDEIFEGAEVDLIKKNIVFSVLPLLINYMTLSPSSRHLLGHS